MMLGMKQIEDITTPTKEIEMILVFRNLLCLRIVYKIKNVQLIHPRPINKPVWAAKTPKPKPRNLNILGFRIVISIRAPNESKMKLIRTIINRRTNSILLIIVLFLRMFSSNSKYSESFLNFNRKYTNNAEG